MIESITTRLAAWRQRRETVRELSLMNDRELAELGIGRGDIAAVADGSLQAVEPAFEAPSTLPADGDLIGPAWAAHAPTSLAA